MYRGGDLSTKGRDLSTAGETRLLRGRLVYGGGDSSTEGGDSSKKGEAPLGTKLDAIGNVKNGPNTVCAEYMYMNKYMYI